jgi:hypothetical protein
VAVNWRKTVATALFALVLASPVFRNKVLNPLHLMMLRRTPLHARCKLKLGVISSAFTRREFKICARLRPADGV